MKGENMGGIKNRRWGTDFCNQCGGETAEEADQLGGGSRVTRPGRGAVGSWRKTTTRRLPGLAGPRPSEVGREARLLGRERRRIWPWQLRPKGEREGEDGKRRPGKREKVERNSLRRRAEGERESFGPENGNSPKEKEDLFLVFSF